MLKTCELPEGSYLQKIFYRRKISAIKTEEYEGNVIRMKFR